MNKINIFFTFLLVVFLASCTEKEVIIPKYTPPTTKKAILIEEFTGVKCTNCPDGAKAIKAMEEKYGAIIVPIAIHNSDYFSEPLSENNYDFRTEVGDKIFGIHSSSSIPKPAASFNRVLFADEEEIPVGPSSWQSSLETELKKQNVTFLDMITEYNNDTRKLEITVTISPTIDLKGDFNLSVAITESNIIDAQTMPDGSINDDYEFDNVLRDMITPFDGTFIGSDLQKDDKIVKSFSYNLPESGDLWIPENINIIAFITGGEKDSTKPVLNAVKKHLIE